MDQHQRKRETKRADRKVVSKRKQKARRIETIAQKRKEKKDASK